MIPSSRLLAGALLTTMLTVDAHAALFRRSHRGGATIALRRRLHVSSLNTEPGTAELEWNNVFDIDGSYSMPLLLKATPEGTDLLWGRTEFSTAFDAVETDHVALAATTLLVDGEHWNLAIAPQMNIWTRASAGARLGGSAIVRYDRGLSSGGATLTWSGATQPSDGNPAGTWDFNPGYGRRLTAEGWTSHISLYANGLLERSTGTARVLAAIEGLEVELSDKVSLIVSGQQTRIARGQMDYQIVTGLTVNFGRQRWLKRH